MQLHLIDGYKPSCTALQAGPYTAMPQVMGTITRRLAIAIDGRNVP